MDGIANVHARIQEIVTRFDGPAAAVDPTADPTAATATADTFAAALAQATPANASIPPTGGSLNRVGVDPVQWAKDFLSRLGMPITAENVKVMTAWEQAEGTKAKNNPLATTQSGFAGETRFNSVGVKNYASYADGLDANVKAVTNGLYGNILAALRKGNDANAAAQAITNSRWGTGPLVQKILAAQTS